MDEGIFVCKLLLFCVDVLRGSFGIFKVGFLIGIDFLVFVLSGLVFLCMIVWLFELWFVGVFLFSIILLILGVNYDFSVCCWFCLFVMDIWMK